MIDTFLTDGWLIVAAALVAIFGVGRLSRIVTYDDFPPAARIRAWWRTRNNDGPWTKLLTCPWCFTPWAMLACLGWFAAGLWVLWIAIAWWVFWGWLALSYAASIVIAYDERD